MAARLFVAVDLPETHLDALLALREPSLDVRWTPREQFHITLSFLGDVEEETIGRLTEALGTIDAAPFVLRAAGLDAFPSARNPRVLVVDVEPVPELLRLQRATDAVARSLGIETDRRPYHPHITLGRLRQQRARAAPEEAQSVRAYLRAHTAFALPPFPVEAFHLYQSTLGSTGAVHAKRAAFPLRPA